MLIDCGDLDVEQQRVVVFVRMAAVKRIALPPRPRVRSTARLLPKLSRCPVGPDIVNRLSLLTSSLLAARRNNLSPRDAPFLSCVLHINSGHIVQLQPPSRTLPVCRGTGRRGTDSVTPPRPPHRPYGRYY
jgi:hypothetical protein